MSVLSSIYFYNIVFGIILFFLHKGKFALRYRYLGIFILLLLSVLRYDIGADYENYANSIQSLAYYCKNFTLKEMLLSTSRYEPSYLLFVWLFRDTQHAYIFVLGIFSIITIFFYYKALRDSGHKLFWGIFAIIAFSILFNSYNGVRQAVSYSIFLYCVKFLSPESINIRKYVLYVILATLFHYSAIILLIVIPLMSFKSHIRIYLVTIIILYLGAIFGILGSLRDFIFQNAFMYEDLASNINFQGRYSSLGILFAIQVFSFVYLMFQIRNKHLYANILFIGISLFLISSGNLSINRIAYYFLYIVVLALPLYMEDKNNKVIKYIYTLLLLFSFECILYLKNTNDGCVPYDYIGGELFQKQHFRIREYKLSK